MAISIEVPQIFRRHTNGSKVLTVNGATIREILYRLGREYPELKRQLLGEDGRLHRFVNIYLNDEDIRYIQDLETPLRDGDRVSILPAVAGGLTAGGLPAVTIGGPASAGDLPATTRSKPGQGRMELRP